MSEKITFGIRNVHYAEHTEDASDNPVFGTVKPWTGASEMSLPPVGEPMEVYADDVLYYKGHVNQGYDGNLNVYQVPEDFKINHIGEYKDTNGVMIEKSSAQPKEFALLGEFQTDENPKRFALYKCSAGRSDFSGTTKEDTMEAQLFNIPITCMPTKKDEIVKASIRKSDNEGVFNAWFSSVYFNPSYVAMKKVTVTVTASSSPVSGAVVVVGEKIAKTDASGKAVFLMVAGTYDVLVSKAGYTPDTDSVTVASSDVDKAITLVGV